MVNDVRYHRSEIWIGFCLNVRFCAARISHCLCTKPDTPVSIAWPRDPDDSAAPFNPSSFEDCCIGSPPTAGTWVSPSVSCGSIGASWWFSEGSWRSSGAEAPAAVCWEPKGDVSPRCGRFEEDTWSSAVAGWVRRLFRNRDPTVSGPPWLGVPSLASLGASWAMKESQLVFWQGCASAKAHDAREDWVRIADGCTVVQGL